MTREEAISILKKGTRFEPTLENKDYPEAFEMAIKALEQEPCEDCISRQAVLDLIEHYNSDGLGSVFYGYDEGVKFANAVNKLPSVNLQESTTGHWITCDVLQEVKCSECRMCFRHTTKYCPNCGCRMSEVSE